MPQKTVLLVSILASQAVERSEVGTVTKQSEHTSERSPVPTALHDLDLIVQIYFLICHDL